MAFTKHERPAAQDPDRVKVKFAIGLDLEGVVVSISERKPSSFGGEVRYVDVDTTDGRKVGFGVSGFKLEIFEEVGYQVGDGFRVEIEEAKTADGSKTYGYPVFSIDQRSARVAAAPAAAVDDNPPF